jgi:tetratricopeptide (TPR) repeat protein
MLFACPVPALADSSGDAEAARALFRSGRGLAAEGKYEQACPKFEQSLKLDPGLGTKFNLADCYERLGKTATARTLFLDVASLARQAGQSDREQVAAARAKDLEPQLHTLTIDVPSKPTGLTIFRDGKEVLPSQWGAPQPVDPGKYELHVTAPGKKDWVKSVEVPRSGDLTVSVPELDDPEAEAPGAAPAAGEEKRAAPAPANDETLSSAPAGAPTDLTIPLIVYGGLGAGAVLGATALILYKSANDDAAAICPTDVNCSHDDIRRHQELVNDARDARTLGYVGLGVAGAAAITGGIIALVRSGREGSAHPRVTAGPILAPGHFGAAMQGRF